MLRTVSPFPQQGNKNSSIRLGSAAVGALLSIGACGDSSDGSSGPVDPTDLDVTTTETETNTPLVPDATLEPSENPVSATPLVVEAESGTVGSDTAVTVDAIEPAVTYVTATTDAVEAPELATDARVSSVDVTFPTDGEYQVYARFRVGPGGADDDSFYLDLGTEEAPDWLLLNNIAGYSTAGQTGYQANAFIEDLGGDSTPGAWKWGLLSGALLTVGGDTLTGTFRFATREDGLDLDKFAFASPEYAFTVDQLDTVSPGVRRSEEGLGAPIDLVQPGDVGGPGDVVDSLPQDGSLAAGQSKFLGGVCCGNQRPGLEDYFNQITPENAGKWGSVEAVRDQFNWAGLDEAVELAEANGFLFRFHVLLWGSQQPDWIEALPPEEQLEEIREWMEAVNERYAGRFDYIEVLNEFDNQPPTAANEGNYLDALGGAGTTGFDWILTGFRMAREVFGPDARLMLNEYSVVNSDQRTSTYLEVVELLQAENLVDILGFQGHAFSTRGNVDQMVTNINRLGATGLPVMVTELDIDGPEVTQLIDYQRIFPAFWENDNVMGVTLWGYRDGHWRQAQGATLVTADGVEKPALRWLKGYVRGTAPVISGEANVTLAVDAAVGAEVAAFDAAAPAQGVQPDAPTQWAIADADAAVADALAFADDGSGRLELVSPVAAGTYELRIYVDMNATVSNLFSVQLTVQ